MRLVDDLTAIMGRAPTLDNKRYWDHKRDLFHGSREEQYVVIEHEWSRIQDEDRKWRRIDEWNSMFDPPPPMHVIDVESTEWRDSIPLLGDGFSQKGE